MNVSKLFSMFLSYMPFANSKKKKAKMKRNLKISRPYETLVICIEYDTNNKSYILH